MLVSTIRRVRAAAPLKRDPWELRATRLVIYPRPPGSGPIEASRNALEASARDPLSALHAAAPLNFRCLCLLLFNFVFFPCLGATAVLETSIRDPPTRIETGVPDSGHPFFLEICARQTNPCRHGPASMNPKTCRKRIPIESMEIAAPASAKAERADRQHASEPGSPGKGRGSLVKEPKWECTARTRHHNSRNAPRGSAYSALSRSGNCIEAGASTLIA